MMKPETYQFLVGCFTALGSFLFGYDLGVIAEVIASDSFKDLFLHNDSATKSGTVVALFTGGCFVGALGSGYTAPLGRRWTIFLACCIFIAGGIIQTAAVVIGMLYAGRLTAGIGVGFLCMTIPMYHSEISHRRIRGRIVCLQQLFNAFGQIVATWTGYGCYLTWTGTGDSREWRIPLAIQIIPALFLASMIFLFPESPRWLCSQDKWDEGRATLARLHSQGDEDDSYVLAEFELIKNQISEERLQRSKGYLDLFRDWPNLRRTILVTMIQSSCQLTGVSAIQYFAPVIFAQLGISTSTSLLFNGVNAIIASLGTATTMLVIDRVGRRPLEIYGAILMSITYIVNASLIKVYPAGSSNAAAHWTFISLTWVFNYVFFVTSGPLSWAIPAELFGTALRVKGVSWGAMVSFAFNTMIGQVTPIAVSSIGWRFYLIFIIFNATSAIFFWAFLPETKGLNLEDMDELFRDSPTFIPGSSWQPSSRVDEEAQKLAAKRTGSLKTDKQDEQIEDVKRI